MKTVERELLAQYNAFSCPNPEFVAVLDTLVPLIVREYSAGLCAAYVGRNAERIAASSKGLIDYVGVWFTDPTAISQVIWEYGFGNLYRSFAESHADHTRYCAVIAGAVAAAGLPGSWEARFQRPLRLRLGSRMLPYVSHVTVAVSTGTISVKYEGPDGNGEMLFAAQCDQSEELCQVGQHGVRFTLLTKDAIDLIGFPEFDGRVVSAIEPRMAQVFHEAIDIIKSYTPEYLPWIARVLHQVFLLKPTAKRIESGSVENYLGLIHLSAHPEPLPVAELLVHEATHQYMNVLRKLQPLDDGSDTREFWSPPVNSNRPISKVIAALHAFGNVQLFYRLCASRGLPNHSECERQERIMQEWLDVLVQHTIGNASISPTGNALCKPLLEKLGRHPTLPVAQ